MNLADVAERLGKSKRTVMRWVEEGRFPEPAVRAGRLVTWNERAVERWCSKHRFVNGGKAIYAPPAKPRKAARKRVVGNA